MKKKSLFLLAPLALAALASCGGSTSWSKTTYEKAVEIAETFSKNLGDYNKKASRSTISGTIGVLDFHGDARIKTNAMDLDLNKASVKISNQEIAEASIDMNSLRILTNGGSVNKFLYALAFPASSQFVKFMDGIKTLPLEYYYNDKFDWKTVEHQAWENIETTFYKATSGNKSKLRVDLKTDDFVKAYDEVNIKTGGTSKSKFSDDTKFTVKVSFTTNEWGYVDTLSARLEAPTLVYEDVDAYPDILAVDGSFRLSLNLKFSYEYIETRTIQFQVAEYKDDGSIAKTEVASIDDDKITKYIKGDWYNYNNPDPTKNPSYVDSYDDPIFNLYYWIKRSRSIAYTGEAYALNIVPKFKPFSKTQITYEPEYKFLFEQCALIIDGKKIDFKEDYVCFDSTTYVDYEVDVGEPGEPELIHVNLNGIGKFYINGSIISGLQKNSSVVFYVAVQSTQA